MRTFKRKTPFKRLLLKLHNVKQIDCKYSFLLLICDTIHNFGVRQGSVLSPFLFAVYLDDLSKLCSPFDACYKLIILYADDILLISPSITNLERLLHRCEDELAWLYMSINLKKSSCLRVGPRCDATCAVITSSTGRSLPCMVEEVRYLGVHFVKSRSL